MRTPTIPFALAVLLGAGTAFAADFKAQVTAVDPAAGRVTLKHGAIKQLDMEAMTMAYRVADPKLLDGIKPGDRVTFDVKGADDDRTVTKLRKAR